jgi:hypothetical protein
VGDFHYFPFPYSYSLPLLHLPASPTESIPTASFPSSATGIQPNRLQCLIGQLPTVSWNNVPCEICLHLKRGDSFLNPSPSRYHIHHISFVTQTPLTILTEISKISTYITNTSTASITFTSHTIHFPSPTADYYDAIFIPISHMNFDLHLESLILSTHSYYVF